MRVRLFLPVAFCCFVLFSQVVLAQTNPVPLVNQPLVPTSAAPGGPTFSMTVNGTGFVSASVVNWDGAPLTTTFVTSLQLTATVPTSNIANAVTASIAVVNPAPGGGTSNVMTSIFLVPFPPLRLPALTRSCIRARSWQQILMAIRSST